MKLAYSAKQKRQTENLFETPVVKSAMKVHCIVLDSLSHWRCYLVDRRVLCVHAMIKRFDRLGAAKWRVSMSLALSKAP